MPKYKLSLSDTRAEPIDLLEEVLRNALDAEQLRELSQRYRYRGRGHEAAHHRGRDEVHDETW